MRLPARALSLEPREQISKSLPAGFNYLTDKKVSVKIKEIKQPDTDALVIAQNIARQLKGRAAFRRTIKIAVQNAMRAGAQGIKVKISGRLGGA